MSQKAWHERRYRFAYRRLFTSETKAMPKDRDRRRPPVPSQYDLIPFLSWQESTPNIDMTGGQVLEADNRRVGIIWSNLSIDNVRVRPGQEASATQGVLLVAQDTPFVMEFSKYGVILGADWYGQADGAGSDLYILEILFQPPGRLTLDGEIQGLESLLEERLRRLSRRRASVDVDAPRA